MHKNARLRRTVEKFWSRVFNHAKGLLRSLKRWEYPTPPCASGGAGSRWIGGAGRAGERLVDSDRVDPLYFFGLVRRTIARLP